MHYSVWKPWFQSKQGIVYTLYVAVFFLPISQTMVDIFLASSLVLSVRHCLETGRFEWKIGPAAWPAAGFMLMAFLSVFSSRVLSFSFYNYLLLPGAYLLLYTLIYTYIKTRDEKKKILFCFLFGAAAVVVYGFYQYGHIKNMAAMDWVDPERFPLLYRRMYSTLGNPNLLGAYLVMAVTMTSPFALMEKEKRNKVLLVGFLGICMAALLLTYSRNAWVSLGCAVLAAAIVYDRRLFAVIGAAALFIFIHHGQVTERFLSLFTGNDTSTDLRFALWESTCAMIQDHWIFGVGWGSYFLAYPAYNFFIEDPRIIIYHAHNMYLSMAAEIGIPGALCFFLFFFGQGVLGWHLYKKGRDCFNRSLGLGMFLTVTAMAVEGLGDYVFFSRAVSLCFWGMAALSSSCWAAEKKNKN